MKLHKFGFLKRFKNSALPVISAYHCHASTTDKTIEHTYLIRVKINLNAYKNIDFFYIEMINSK